MTSRTTTPDAVSGADLARILGLTPARVSQLKSDGVLTAVSGGKFDLPKAIQSYIAFLETGALSPELTEHRARLLKQQERRLRIANDRAEKLVINTADVKQLIGLLISIAKTQIQALPGRCAAIVASGNSAVAYAKLREETNSTLNAMADEVAKFAAEIEHPQPLEEPSE